MTKKGPNSWHQMNKGSIKIPSVSYSVHLKFGGGVCFFLSFGCIFNFCSNTTNPRMSGTTFFISPVPHQYLVAVIASLGLVRGSVRRGP